MRCNKPTNQPTTVVVIHEAPTVVLLPLLLVSATTTPCNLQNPIARRVTHNIKMLSFAITTHAFPVIAINKWKQRHMQRQMQRVSLSASIHHDMMHKEVEVYVDDMIAKSKKVEDHVVHM